MMKESSVPENEPPPPLPWLAVSKSLLDRWRERPKLSEASPKWIAVTAPLWALLGALCAGGYAAVANLEFLHPGPVQPPLLLPFAAALPVGALSRSWRYYLIAVGILFAGGLTGVWTMSRIGGSSSLFTVYLPVGVGIGAGLGLGLGLARRTLSGLLGGMLVGQVAGIAGVMAGLRCAAAVSSGLFWPRLLGHTSWSMGLACGVCSGLMYLIILLSLAAIEHVAARRAR